MATTLAIGQNPGVAPLAVDPEAMFVAGSAVAAVGEDLVAALGTLTAGFGANTGQDAAGDMFGLAYQEAAKSLVKAAAAAINACRHNGARIQLSASNYSRAEAASTLGGGSGVLPAPHDPEQFSAPGPPGTLGAGPPPPMLWRVVELFVGDLWPNGDVAGLHAAAGCWRGFAAALGGAEQGLNGPKAVIAGQEIPEGPLIQPVLSEVGATMASLGKQCEQLAATLDNFADEVAHAQNAIRDLLHRLGSASGLWHEVVSIFDGDGLQEVKEIAEDIKAVLHNLGREAQAKEQAMQRGMGVADGLVRGMERYVRSELTHFLGAEVGNPLATVFDFFTNVTEGVYKAAFSTVVEMDQLSPRHFLTDPEGAAAAWEGLDVTAVRSLPAYALLDPDGAAQTWKGLLHLDDWSKDRPGLGLGENLFDVGTSFLKVGEARRFGMGERAPEEGVAGEEGSGATRVGAPGGSGQLGEITHSGEALTSELEDLGGDLPKTDPKTSGEPSALPTREPPRPPVEAPRPAESAPSMAPAESRSAPEGSATVGSAGLHDPATPVGSRPSPAPAAGGDQMPSTTSRLTESTPAPGAAEGAPVKPASAATAPASPAPQASAPRFTESTSPTELARPGSGSPHCASDGISSNGRPPESSPHVSAGDMPGDRGSQEPPIAPGDPLHSHERSGPGWHRLPDKATDPHYGEPLSDSWNFPDDPVDPSGIKKTVAQLIADPEAPFGRDPQGRAYTEQEYVQRFNKLSPTGDRWMNFPGNDGAVPGTKIAFTDADQLTKFYGRQFDRIGNVDGKYLAIMVDGVPASWEARALHINSLREPYNAYEFDHLPTGWHVEVSEVAPGVGQPGGSIQVRIFDSEGRALNVEELLDIGVLR
ncbi:Outer membrane channel protein CpnT [Mycobacterium attenuatum]|uniref:Outer membrane channel protein CpnT n=1 Tax=Mycobacterium attenuatum TaxID=2341086 RepID=A0A498Q7C4_9MYCO|nr:Outer membrane channel protein CpnT [Mycobacterium attenuatum]